MTSLRPLERFLGLSLLLHILIFSLIQLLYKGPMVPEERPMLVEVLPLPKVEEKKPERPRILSDINRRVLRETRQFEPPSAGVQEVPPPPKPPELSARAAPRDIEAPPKPPPIPEVIPPRPAVESPPKVTIPKSSEKEEPDQGRLTLPPVPPTPELRRPPSLAEELASLLSKPSEPQSARPSEKVASVPKSPEVPYSPPPLIRQPAKELPLSRLLPSRESLEKFQSTRREGTTAKVMREETISLNTQEFKYYSYFVKLKRRIEEVWEYPMEARMQGQQGQLFMEFSIRRDGTLEEIRLLRSSFYPILDEEALRAVRTALKSPLPLPEVWGLDRIKVKASFTYELTFWSIQ